MQTKNPTLFLTFAIVAGVEVKTTTRWLDSKSLTRLDTQARDAFDTMMTMTPDELDSVRRTMCTFLAEAGLAQFTNEPNPGYADTMKDWIRVRCNWIRAAADLFTPFKAPNHTCDRRRDGLASEPGFCSACRAWEQRRGRMTAVRQLVERHWDEFIDVGLYTDVRQMVIDAQAECDQAMCRTLPNVQRDADNDRAAATVEWYEQANGWVAVTQRIEATMKAIKNPPKLPNGFVLNQTVHFTHIDRLVCAQIVEVKGNRLMLRDTANVPYCMDVETLRALAVAR